jgi:hypothetical protein
MFAMVYVYNTKEKGCNRNSVKYRSLSVNWEKWEIASKPRKNITLGVKFISP